MAKIITMDNKKLLSIIPSDLTYIEPAEIIKLINDKIEHSSIINNTFLFVSTNKRILTDVYHNVKVSIDVFSDIEKTLNKTGTRYRYKLLPYDIVINIFANNNNIYHYASNKQVRRYNIIEAS